MRAEVSGETVARRRLVEALQREGILRTPEIIQAFLAVSRERFVPPHLAGQAYDDNPLPIGEGQTISAPHMCAIMLEALDLKLGQRVLEVGAGSGYHAALAAHLVGPNGRVSTVERLGRLAAQAEKNLAAAGYADRVAVVVGDGSVGLPAHAPYNRIFVTAGSPAVPQPLVDQLAIGGRLLVPVGPGHLQELVQVDRAAKGTRRTSLGGCVFVPLIGEHGFSR